MTTLPIALRGSSSRKWTSRGRLWGASWPATWSISSRSCGAGSPSATTQATIRSPRSVVGRAGHGRLEHARVLEQRDLDLARADLVAAGLDQVGRAAADDPPVAVRRARCEVAGEEPAVAQRLGGGVRAVEVAAEQVRTAHGDLADRLVVGGLDVAAVVGHQADLDAGDRHADVARPAGAVGADRRVHERLGEAVALDDLLARQPFDALELRRRQRRGAGDEQPGVLEAVDDRAVVLGRAPEAVVHRRHAEQHRRPVAQRGGGRGRLEAAEVAQLAAAAQRSEQAEHEAVDVEQRQPVGQDVVARPVPRVGEPVEVGGDRAPRQHGALRAAGRAGRVDDQRRVLVTRRDGGKVAAARCRIGAGEARRVVELRQPAGGRADEDVGTAVGQHVRELAGAELRVDGDDRDARLQRGDHRDARRERGVGPDRDALGPQQLGGERRGGLAQLTVGQALPGDGHGRLRASFAHRRQQRSGHLRPRTPA